MAASCNYEVMKGDKRTCLKQPAVTFQLVRRQSTPAQAEAGERLIKRLVARAQSRINQASSEETSSWRK
ncbi:hypothetical protein ES708_11453 [subsurface metagenome]